MANVKNCPPSLSNWAGLLVRSGSGRQCKLTYPIFQGVNDSFLGHSVGQFLDYGGALWLLFLDFCPKNVPAPDTNTNTNTDEM